VIPVIQLVSYPGSGAPGSFDRIVSELADEDVRVGVVTMSAQDSIGRSEEVLPPLSSGAAVNVIAGNDRVIAVEEQGEAPSLDQVHLRFFNNVDVVLHRGFVDPDLPEIMFHGSDSNESDLGKGKNIFATVGFESGFRNDLPSFEEDDPGALARFIIRTFHIRRRREKRKNSRASLLVNGKNVGMQKFVENLIVSVMAGFIKALKHTGDAKEVELFFKFPEEE